MTASVLKQDPNTKRFKRTLIYYDTDTQYANFRELHCHANNLPSTEQATTAQPKKKKKKKVSFSFFIVFNRLSVV